MKKEDLIQIINNPNIESDIKMDAQLQLDKLLALENEDDDKEVNGVDFVSLLSKKEVDNFAQKIDIHIKTNSTFEMFSIPSEFEQILKEKCSQFLEKMRIDNPLNLVKNLEVEQDYYVSGEFFFNGLTNKIEIWVKAKQMEITYPKIGRITNDTKLLIPQNIISDEEVAERYAEGKSSSSVFQKAHIRDFMAGAKWQAERMCNHTYILTSEQGHRVIKCQKCDDTQPI